MSGVGACSSYDAAVTYTAGLLAGRQPRLRAKMRTEILGFASSLALWLGALKAHLLTQSRAVRALPPAWRKHPETRKGYDSLVNLRIGDLKSDIRSRTLSGVGFAALFTGLSAIGLAIGVGLLTCVSLSLMYTYHEFDTNRATRDAFLVRTGLERLPRNRSLSAAFWLGRFITWFGWLALTCFAGYLLVAVIEG